MSPLVRMRAVSLVSVSSFHLHGSKIGAGRRGCPNCAKKLSVFFHDTDSITADLRCKPQKGVKLGKECANIYPVSKIFVLTDENFVR